MRDPPEFKLTTITLLDGPASDSRRPFAVQSPSFAPPLSIHSPSHWYRLRASTTEPAGNHIPPSCLPMSTWRWLSPCPTVATIRTGVLCFVPPAEGAMSASKYGFLVIWSVQLPKNPTWSSWDDSYLMLMPGDINIETMWWTKGTPLLHILPYSALDDHVRSGLEALERGTASGELSRFLQKHFTTADGLFSKTMGNQCACWVSGNPQDHVYTTGAGSYRYLKLDTFSMRECAKQAAEYAGAAAKRWIPCMVPQQEVTFGDITVTASIRKLQFLDRTSFSLEIKARWTEFDATAQGGGARRRRKAATRTLNKPRQLWCLDYSRTCAQRHERKRLEFPGRGPEFPGRNFQSTVPLSQFPSRPLTKRQSSVTVCGVVQFPRFTPSVVPLIHFPSHSPPPKISTLQVSPTPHQLDNNLFVLC